MHMYKMCVVTINDASSNAPLMYSYGTYSVPSYSFFARDTVRLFWHSL